ncbi:MAG: 4Fe-4S dicluster domain-containing protein [Chloroflexi bacterium]|nr:4Fe-4S dicluster domain-containing protein [Chloroflexota bacterium]
MTHIITSLCLRDSACVDVCPVECIVGGQPEEDWPWFYIDPETCIDCGACVPECPYEAIFIEDEVPTALSLAGGQVRVPHDTKEHLTAEEGETVDLTPDIQPNYDFFEKGPGYDALNM